MTENPPRIDLLRHGSVRGGDCLRGWQDDPLDDNGWRQMWDAVSAHPPWQRIVSSPLQRCAAFAGTLAERTEVPLETDPRWRELSFGRWEGRTVADIQAQEAESLQRFWDDPAHHSPPGGETLTALQHRCTEAWRQLADGLDDGDHSLLVTHGGVIRLLLCELLGMPPEQQFRFEVPHAALISVIADQSCPRLYLGSQVVKSSRTIAARQ